MQPVTPEFLSVLFPMSLIMQEVSTERWIEIPEPVREIYKLWRPTPMHRAIRLEKALGTPAHIYYSMKAPARLVRTSRILLCPRLFIIRRLNKALTTETGAGQWGSALAMACNFFGLDSEVYMVKVSYHQKPYRRIIMENFGAKVYASPTNRTQYGRKTLARIRIRKDHSALLYRRLLKLFASGQTNIKNCKISFDQNKKLIMHLGTGERRSYSPDSSQENGYLRINDLLPSGNTIKYSYEKLDHKKELSQIRILQL